MIKQGILNFFKNLKYFFTPLGTLALGLIFGLSVLIPGMSSSVSDFSNEVQLILNDTSVDFTALKNSAASAIQALDWSDPLIAVRTMLSNDWLLQTLNECVSSFVGNTEAYTTQFIAAIETFTGEIATYIVVLIIFLFLGLIGGFFLTKWLIRRNIAKRALWKYLLNLFVDSLLNATLVAVCFWLMTIWKPSVIISSFILILLSGFISLLEAYIIHAWRKVDIKQLINVKNIFKLFLTDIIIFFLAGACVSLVTAITNNFVGIFIGIVLMEIALIVINLNAEAYAKSFAEDKANENTEQNNTAE